MELPPGKLRNEILREVIFSNLGLKDESVVYGPREGFDSAVLEYNDDRYLVIATDPVIGAPRGAFGFFAYHFASSDVAVFGADPKWLIIDLLFPEGTTKEFISEIMGDLHEECLKYGGSVIGGHTGVYPSLTEPVGTATVMGLVRKDELKLPLAKPGDRIVVTAKVGLEFAVSAAYFKSEELSKVLSKKEIMRLKRSFYFETVVPDALVARRFARGMHDATEGGLTALHEIADNSRLGFKVYAEKLHLDPLVKKVLEFYNIKPWGVSSTGTLIAITSPEKANELITELIKNGILAFELGEFMEDDERILVENGEERSFPRFEGDPYIRFYEKPAKVQ